MTDSDNRYGDAPLGRSVEEVEQDNTNRVNSPLPGEQVRDDNMLAGVPVPPVLSGPAGTALIPGITDGERVTDGGGDADDGTTRDNRDSSEENG